MEPATRDRRSSWLDRDHRKETSMADLTDDDMLSSEIAILEAEGFVSERWQRGLVWLRELRARRAVMQRIEVWLTELEGYSRNACAARLSHFEIAAELRRLTKTVDKAERTADHTAEKQITLQVHL